MNRPKTSRLFADALASLLEGGLQPVDALRVISGEGFPVKVRLGATLALESMGRGVPFDRALGAIAGRKDSPFAFTRAHIALVAAAGRTGRGEFALREIARDIGDRIDATGAFAASLAYPILVVAFALALTVALRIVAIPRLAFFGMGVPDDGTVARGIACALAFLASSIGAAFLAVIRVFGRDSPEYSFFYPLAFLTRNGVTVHESLALCEACVGDPRTRAIARCVSRRLGEGMPAARAFAETGKFGPFATAWIEVADRSGDPASAFVRIASHFKARDLRSRELASRMIEPALMAITGIYVLILVETVILPVLTATGGFNA